MGDVEGALADANRAVALGPADPAAWHVLGMCLRDRGDVAGTRAAFEHAIAIGLRPNAAAGARTWLQQNPR